MNKSATAFAPGGISSFFEICDKVADGTPIIDLESIGSRGGGFVIQQGVRTQVTVAERKRNTVTIYVDGQLAPQAETTLAVTNELLARSEKKYAVTVKHKTEVPIGAGFGSSAAGSLGAALALSKALDLNLTFNQLGRIAHVAEVKCRTGLGTVGPIMLGGCIITIEPGAPGIGIIDRIPLNPEYMIVSGVFGSTPTKEILASVRKRREVNCYGRKTLEAILAEPSVENFMACCLDFAQKSGFMTDRLRKLVKIAEKSGAVGVAQNMVGEAIHAIVLEENAGKMAEAFKQVLPNQKVLATKIDLQGARLINNEEV